MGGDVGGLLAYPNAIPSCPVCRRTACVVQSGPSKTPCIARQLLQSQSFCGRQVSHLVMDPYGIDTGTYHYRQAQNRMDILALTLTNRQKKI